ncbi:MAG: RHS repeat protein, partial [Phycisphaerae bacterium]|nr:RHS repeat protein [Phycisphaerae bacterium]
MTTKPQSVIGWLTTVSFLAGVILLAGPVFDVKAADNPALGIGEPNTPWPPPCPGAPGCDPCPGPGCDPCRSSSSPVLAHNGRLYETFTDLSFGLRTIPFSVSRVHLSDEFYVGLFGRGVVSSLDMMSIPTYKGDLVDEVVVVRWPDGQRSVFTKQPDSTYALSLGRTETLTKVAGGFELTTLKEDLVYTFDEMTRLLSIADRDGNEVTFGYDEFDRPVSVILPGSREITIEYNDDGFISSITDFVGRVVSYGYNEGRFLTSYTDAGSNTWTYEYADDRFSRIINPLDEIILDVTYDSIGRVSRIIDKEGDFTYAYVSGTQTTKTDNITSGVWTNTLDGEGVITSTRDPLGGTTLFQYDSVYNLTAIRDAASRYTYFTYNDEGKRLTRTDAAGNTDTYTYNAEGLMETRTNGRGVVTRLEYDAAGRMTASHIAHGTADVATALYAYDAAGNQTSKTDPLNYTTTMEYDAYGQLTQVTDPLLHDTLLTYDGIGQVLTTTAPNGATTTNEYDQPGRLTRRVEWNGAS